MATLCCLEDALLDGIRAITCNPIRPERHFANKAQGRDCVPYLVLKASQLLRLRTSDGATYDSVVDISAYFAEIGEISVPAFRDSMEAWAGHNCLDLGECGSFCVAGISRSTISDPGGGLVRYNLNFRGMYSAFFGVASESA